TRRKSILQDISDILEGRKAKADKRTIDDAVERVIETLFGNGPIKYHCEYGKLLQRRGDNESDGGGWQNVPLFSRVGRETQDRLGACPHNRGGHDRQAPPQHR